MASDPVEYNIDAEFIEGNDPWAIIEPVFLTVSIYDGVEKYEQDLSTYSQNQRLVLACHLYMYEVNNGGHHQFYYNSTGIVWRDALECFNVMGATEFSEIIEISAERLGGSPRLSIIERNGTLDKPGLEFGDLDSRFYKLDSQLDIEKMLKDFILDN